MNAGSLCHRVMLTMATRSMFFFIFRKKGIEFFALLTTELSSYKMCKVVISFCTLYAGFNLM